MNKNYNNPTNNANPWQQLKDKYKHGGTLWRLIIINAGIFVVLFILGILSKSLANGIVSFLSFPNDLTTILYKPCTIITYMFTHVDFMHVLFNMIMLYFVGQLFLNYSNPRKLLSIFFVGGIASGLLFAILTQTNISSGSYLIGASGSIMALFFYATIYNPNQKIMLLGMFPMKIMWIAAVFILNDLIQINNGENVGGHIAHLGGAAYGWYSVTQFKKGKNPEAWIEAIIYKVYNLDFSSAKPKVGKKANMKAKYYGAKTKTQSSKNNKDYNAAKKEKQEVIDAILDKIAKSGYESLSKEEKAILFDASNN